MLTDDPALIAAALELRYEVFVVGQGVARDLERDGRDPSAVHSVIVSGGAVVATGRLTDEGVRGRLGRIAVRADLRGRGFGVAVVDDLCRAAAAAGLPRLRLHAQLDVVRFYEKLGWRTYAQPGFEAGIAHRWMRRDLLPGLRAVRDEDSAALGDLVGGCYAEYPGCVLEPTGYDRWMQAPASTYADRGGGLWVVADRSELVASVGWVPVPHTGHETVNDLELRSLYVRASHRRRGYAAALVGLVDRVARARGAAAVRLWTDTRFTDAHRLYLRLGFVQQPGERVLDDPSESVELPFRREIPR